MSNTNLGTATITFKGDFDAFERDIQRANAKVDQFNKMMASPEGQRRLEMAAMAARKLNAEMANMSRLNLIANEKVWQKQKLAQEKMQERDENWLAKQEAREAKRIQREAAAARARQERDENWLAKQEAREAKRIQKEKAAAEARQRRDEDWLARREAKEARVMARQEREEAKKAQRGRMQLAAGGVGIGAAAIGAASVASPLAADTLQGSIKLLTATVGREFVPMVMQLSFALQDAAKWWRELDPAIKSATAETAKMVAVAGSAVVALAGVGKVLSLIAAHPIVAAAGAGVALGNLANAKLNEAGNRQAAGIHGLASSPDLVEAEKLAAKDARTEFFKNRKDGVELARLDLLRAVNTRNEAVEKNNNYQKGWFGGGGFVGGAQRGLDWFGGKQEALMKDVEKASIDQVKAQARLNAVLKANGQDPAAPNRHLLDMVGGAAFGGLEGGKRGGALGSMGPSSYSSLQDFYRTFNVNATSGSSLEAQTLQIQTETKQAIIDMHKTIEMKLGKAN